MATTTAKRRITTASLFSLTCGCKDSRSVSVPVSISDPSDKSDKSDKSTPKPPRPDLSSASTLTSAASSSSDDRFDEASSTPSFSGLLRELTELERSVLAWGPPPPPPPPAADRRRSHRRARSEGVVFRVAEESVAVVKESADPLGDFRRSMLQMIVEKEIVGGEELRELLRRFLSLNSPRHHELILRAFAEIWAEVFEGYEQTPDLLRRSHSLRPISLRKS